MTNKSSVPSKQENSKAVAVQEQDLSLVEYGSRKDIIVLAKRIKSLMPGGDKMNLEQAMSLAQYSIMTDANPFRGEVYGFNSRGKFVLVEGYKLLVRWAKRQCPYNERYDELAEDELEDGAIGFRCWILRDDAKATLFSLVEAGATFNVAYEIAATSAVGIVTKSDMTTKTGAKNQPPKGWDWPQVAKKRALKNALNLSHGAPSPREIAAESWQVNGVKTRIEDWTIDATPGMGAEEREQLAVVNAEQRQTKREWISLNKEEKAQRRREISAMLYGDGGDDDLTAEEESEPEPDPDFEGAFESPFEAIMWGVDQGVFTCKRHASNAYEKIKRMLEPKNAAAMADLWRVDVAHRLTEKEDAEIAAQLEQELAEGSPSRGKEKLFKSEANDAD